MSNNTISDGDTAWMLTATALVYMMTPALACFYGGLVESKNFINQLFLSVVCMGIVPVQWCLFGYSFAFGPGNSVFGSFSYAALRFVGLNNLYGEGADQLNESTVPSLVFGAYQCAFAIITPALISGAVVGRMKPVPYMLFVFLWSTFCYDSLARWIFFREGWLHKMGTLDFTGGLVIHLASGVSGLVAAAILGSRSQFDPDVVTTGQTKLPFTILGTGLLWVGWMGFNGGSALAANGLAALAVVNSNVAAASSMVIWIILDIIVGKTRNHHVGAVSIPGACSAIVVGLVVVTPGAGYVEPGSALLMGLIGGTVVFLFLLGKKRYFHIDDTLDVFSCHGLGGFVGTILTGAFCQKAVNDNGSDGALYGRPIQLWYQIAGVLVTTVFSAVCTAAILLPMHYTIGIRINRIDEVKGLDNIIHGIVNEEQPIPEAKPRVLKQRKTAGTINVETIS